ncbi:hypothetical protein ACFXTI_038591 [Malus domestica]
MSSAELSTPEPDKTMQASNPNTNLNRSLIKTSSSKSSHQFIPHAFEQATNLISKIDLHKDSEPFDPGNEGLVGVRKVRQAEKELRGISKEED